MGRQKDWLIEQEERGWSEGPDTSVCPDCFDDDVLSDVVRDNADAFTCDYCGNTAEDYGDASVPIAAPFNTVMDVIAQGIYKEWNFADNEGIPYESAEGGYQFTTHDNWDLVYDWVPVSNEKLQRDIAECLPDQQYCERNFASLDPASSMSLDWENFCRIVKHEKRYVFVRPRTRRFAEYAEPLEGAEPDVADIIDPPDPDENASPEEVLETIGRIVESSDLVRRIPVGTTFSRARIHGATRYYRSPEALGTPPENKVRYPNRMSPSGIAMFYGALDGYTAVAETKTRKLKASETISVAPFVVTKEFSVVDFSKLPPVPSLFSEASRWERGAIRFLHGFVEDLSKPIKRDGREHIEYVPTQIVTEYFRHAFRPDGGEILRGMYYPSSRVPNGVACVLFFDREACGSKPASAFREPQQWLRLDRKGIVRRRGRPTREKPKQPREPQQELFP
ncbi:MAG TPA: HEPN-associated N-terminal domain-containing protein [Bryobacteraceae bacterium]